MQNNMQNNMEDNIQDNMQDNIRKQVRNDLQCSDILSPIEMQIHTYNANATPRGKIWSDIFKPIRIQNVVIFQAYLFLRRGLI